MLHRRGYRRNGFHRGNEAISTAWQCFHEARFPGGIFQNLAHSFYRRVDAVFELDDGVIRPEPALQFLAGYQFPWSLQQDRQHFDRLSAEFQLEAVMVQFSGVRVELVGSKPNQACGSGRILTHGKDLPG